MLALLAALSAASQPAPSSDALGRPAWVYGTVQQSEWCLPGFVRVDVRTGRYAFRARAERSVCNTPGLERPERIGTLRGEYLAAIRAAYLRALADGLTSQECRIVVSNGGPQTLVLTNGERTESAPLELGCWSAAADALHDALDDAFSSADRSYRPFAVKNP
jgi:hypothetical protein